MQSENGNQFDTDVLANGMGWTTYGMDVLLRKISLPQIFSLWYFFIFRAKTNKWIRGAKCYRTYFCPLFFFKWFVMHQSIPAVPIPPPPRATTGHLLTLSVPGVGHSQFYRGTGAGHLHTPRKSPGIWHSSFWKCHGWVQRKRRGVCGGMACSSRTRKTCQCF